MLLLFFSLDNQLHAVWLLDFAVDLPSTILNLSYVCFSSMCSLWQLLKLGLSAVCFHARKKKREQFFEYLARGQTGEEGQTKSDVKNSSEITDKITMRWGVILYVRRESFCQRILGFIANEFGGGVANIKLRVIKNLICITISSSLPKV